MLVSTSHLPTCCYCSFFFLAQALDNAQLHDLLAAFIYFEIVIESKLFPWCTYIIYLGSYFLIIICPNCFSDCDLYHGKWVYDSTGPLYSNNSCPVLTQMQNCQGNGRPDKDYENWRWKPSQCDLPRLDPKKFLELMRGKTLAFIGDSVARNQMESMLCILWQVRQ